MELLQDGLRSDSQCQKVHIPATIADLKQLCVIIVCYLKLSPIPNQTSQNRSLDDPPNVRCPGVLVNLFLHIFTQGEQMHIAWIALIPHRSNADLPPNQNMCSSKKALFKFTYPDSHHITAEFFTVPKHPLPSYVSLTHFDWSPFNRSKSPKSSTGFTVEKSIHPHACAFFKSSGVMPTAWSIACDAPCTLGSVKARETLASVELFLAKLHVRVTRHDYMYFK